MKQSIARFRLYIAFANFDFNPLNFGDLNLQIKVWLASRGSNSNFQFQASYKIINNDIWHD